MRGIAFRFEALVLLRAGFKLTTKTRALRFMMQWDGMFLRWCAGCETTFNSVFTRVFKNEHQAVNPSVRRFGKRSISAICEHLQKPHNTGLRP